MDALEKAVFAAGCFWGVEKALHALDGVVETTVGYTGGMLANPRYADVCSGRTGHFEAVRVLFDPARIRFVELLEEFWALHDPTHRHGQGPDRGSQYMSAVFYHSEQQRQQAHASLEQQQGSGRYRQPLVTRLLPATRFWEAEPEHQKYFLR